MQILSPINSKLYSAEQADPLACQMSGIVTNQIGEKGSPKQWQGEGKALAECPNVRTKELFCYNNNSFPSSDALVDVHKLPASWSTTDEIKIDCISNYMSSEIPIGSNLLLLLPYILPIDLSYLNLNTYTLY